MSESLFEKNLRYLRKVHKLSQEQMAERLNMRRSTYSYFERSSKFAESVLPMRNVFYNKFGYTLDELLTYDISSCEKEGKLLKREAPAEVIRRLTSISDSLVKIEKEIEQIKQSI